MAYNLFVYGTLQNPDKVKALTGKTFQRKSALLRGYRKYIVLCADGEGGYPAILKDDEHVVPGYILFDVDRESMKKFDTYEGPEYYLSKVSVECGETVFKAYTYVWCAARDCLREC